MKALEGKSAFITGAGSGIGRQSAFLMAEAGAKVVVCERDEQAGRGTVQAIEEAGGSALLVIADVSDDAQMRGAIDTACAGSGGIHVLFNNAGIFPEGDGSPVDTPLDIWQWVIDVNLKGVFLGCKYVAPYMKRQGRGAIVNTASVSGLKGHATGMIAYNATKGAVVNMTRLLATELGPFNIRVNVIAPGGVKTPLVANFPRPPAEMNWPDHHAIGNDAMRTALPREIAQAALYLCSDDVGPVNGAILSVDGGRAAR